MLRTLLSLPSRVHNVCLYVISNRFPLSVILTKLVYRYFKRVMGIVDGEGNDNVLLKNTGRWSV